MSAHSRRSFLIFGACALGAASFAGEALAQAYYEPRAGRRRRGPYNESIDSPYAKACRPMCAMDSSPCDTPAQKAADGRCSSPTAGPAR